MVIVLSDVPTGGSSIGLASGNPEWFDRLSARMQAAYLSQHKNSKYKQSKQLRPQALPKNQVPHAPLRHRPNLLHNILNGFENTSPEDLLTKTKQNINPHDVEELQKLVQPDPFIENLKKPFHQQDTENDEEDPVDKEDDEAEHKANGILQKVKQGIPPNAVRILKKIIIGVLIAAGVATALAMTNPHILINATLYLFHQASHGENLLENLWHTLVHGEHNNPADVVANKLYNTFSGNSISDGHLSNLIQQHR